MSSEQNTPPARKASGSRRQTSLRVNHYPVLLLTTNNDDSDQQQDGRVTPCWTPCDVPENCVGGSSWLIGGGPLSNCDSFASPNPLRNSESHDEMAENGTLKSNLSRGQLVQRNSGVTWAQSTNLGSENEPSSHGMFAQQPKVSLTCPAANGAPSGNITANCNGTGHSSPGRGYLSSAAASSSARNHRQKLWSLSPAAFHQSFDDRLRVSTGNSLSNSCGNLDEQLRNHYKRRSAFSSAAVARGGFAGGYSSNHSSAAGGFSAGTRPPALGGRSPQSSFDSNGDVGQISLNWMRVNGTIAPFKALLTSTNSNSDNKKEPGHKTSLISNALNRSGSIKRQPNNHHVAHPIICEISKRKESSASCRLTDIVTPRVECCDGDQLSRKSLSLVLSEDLEAQQNQMDDMKTPLMKEEKGGRLIQRQHLFHSRRVTSDFALFFSLIGIIMMVLENELSAAHISDKGSLASRTLKFGIVFSTAILVMLVIRFHIYEVQLFMNANSAEDWRIAFTWRRVAQIAMEICACGICPLPFDIEFQWTTVHSDGQLVTSNWVSMDVLLSIPMFFRLYWLCRVMLLHSRMFTDASSRSIAGLNRVNFNARFILKTLMTMCPGTIMLFFTASLWVIAAWIMRLCERYHTGPEGEFNPNAFKHQNYLNSLWLIAITFLSVGYGDIVPNTYCGRSMAVITGILGTCTSSMVVAVIARKLELSRAEKHVQNFMMDTHLTKMLKHSAANVLRETWLIYKYRRLVDKIDPGKIRMHQRKFLVAIYELRKVKRDQRKLAENSVSLGDVAKTTSNTYELIHDVHSTQEGLSLRMTAVEHQLSDIQRELSSLTEILRAKYLHDDSLHAPQSPSDPLRRRRAVVE